MNAKKIIGIGVGIAATGYGAYKLLSGKEDRDYAAGEAIRMQCVKWQN